MTATDRPPRCYRLFDVVLASNFAFPAAEEIAACQPDWEVEILPAHAPRPAPPPWFHDWPLPDGSVAVWFGRDQRGYHVRFLDRADFVLSGTRIQCWPLPATTDESICALLVNVVIPLALSTRPRIVLHAAAVAASGGAIGFLGGSGLGKSTLTASFWAHGHAILTDDALALRTDGDRFVAVPGYPGVRLWDDVVSPVFSSRLGNALPPRDPDPDTVHKHLFLGDGILSSPSGPAPLAALCVLGPPPAADGPCPISVARISPREATIEIVRHAYCLDIADAAWRATQFRQVTRLAESVPVYRLSYPRDISRVDELRETILTDAAGSQPQ